MEVKVRESVKPGDRSVCVKVRGHITEQAVFRELSAGHQNGSKGKRWNLSGEAGETESNHSRSLAMLKFGVSLTLKKKKLSEGLAW